MKEYSLSIEAFLKPFLVEWVEALLSDAPQHPLLHRIRSKEGFADNEKDGVICWLLECDYEQMLRHFRQDDWLDYLAYLINNLHKVRVSRDDFREIVISGDSYEYSDFEGASSELKRLIIQQFGKYGNPAFFSIRRSLSHLVELINTRLVVALKEYEKNTRSSHDELKELLGRCRIDFEEIVKHLSYFMALVSASSRDFPTSFESFIKNKKKKKKKMYHLISDLAKTNPSMGKDIEDAAWKKMNELYHYVSKMISNNDLEFLCKCHHFFRNELCTESNQKSNTYTIKKKGKHTTEPYILHTLRIFGNIFQHRPEDYSAELIRKYIDVAGAYLGEISSVVPESIYITGVDYRSSGHIIISVYNIDTEKHHRILYTQTQALQKYRTLRRKSSSEEASSTGKLIRAFMLPGSFQDYEGRQVCFPIIAEADIIDIAKHILKNSEMETHAQIKVLIQMPVFEKISSQEYAQE